MFNCHLWSPSEWAGKKLSLILFVLFCVQWNTDSKPQSLSKRSYNWICVCTQMTKVRILKDHVSLLEKGRGSHVNASAKSNYGSIILYGVTWHQNSCSSWLFIVYGILEKGSSNMPIKGDVFARKDLFWVMSVCMGKICLFFFLWEFSWGFICKWRFRLCMWNHKQVLRIW